MKLLDYVILALVALVLFLVIRRTSEEKSFRRCVRVRRLRRLQRVQIARNKNNMNQKKSVGHSGGFFMC
ncbi:MAG: hypothetical protein R2881_00755 [Eubacteriales bacterium]